MTGGAPGLAWGAMRSKCRFGGLLGRLAGVGSLAAMVAVGAASCPASIAPASQTLAAYSSGQAGLGHVSVVDGGHAACQAAQHFACADVVVGFCHGSARANRVIAHNRTQRHASSIASFTAGASTGAGASVDAGASFETGASARLACVLIGRARRAVRLAAGPRRGVQTFLGCNV